MGPSNDYLYVYTNLLNQISSPMFKHILKMTIQGTSSQGSCAKTLSCGGGHFGFPINKKTKPK